MLIEKSFIINPPEESNLITEAFGIDSGYKNDICNISIDNDWDVLYITGESGSGKTTIAKEIIGDYKNEKIPFDVPLFLWYGESEDSQIRAVKDLSDVGISDATMFLSTYNQLSDSQQARCRIFLEIASSKQTVFVDEFLSTLDRETAKSVAFCIQKSIRKHNKKAIFVTAHNDLEDYIQPTYTIVGTAFPSNFSVNKYIKAKTNPIINKVNLYYGDKNDYKKLRLAELHYKGKYTGGTKEYLFAKLDEKIIGVLVSTYRMSDGGRRISRLVVHPTYRGVGVGKLLVKKYTSDYTSVDVVSAMGRFNCVFESSGMDRKKDVKISPPAALVNAIRAVGFDIKMWHSKSYCLNFSENSENRLLVSGFSNLCTKLVQPGGKKLTTDQICAVIQHDAQTCGRVLYQLRPRILSKYGIK